MPTTIHKLLRSAAAVLLAVVLYGSLVTPVSAREVTPQDLAPDNEKLQRELDGMKTGYILQLAGKPPIPIAEIVAKSATARNYSKAFYTRQIVLRSNEALPLLLAQLTDPGFGQLSEREQGAVLTNLSLIGDPSAVQPILNVTDESENLINRMAWVALLFMPGNQAAVTRALEIAAKPELIFYLRRLPSGYLALNRVERARPIAAAMVQSEGIEEQAAGIWILGSLGDDIRDRAVEILSVPELRYGYESGPLDGLAVQVCPEEMRKIVPAFRQGGESWHTAINRSTMLHALPADPGERTVLCYKMMHNDMPLPWDVSMGLECLLKLNRQDLILYEILITGDARGSIVLAMLQRQGWRMKMTDKDVFLERN